MLSLLLTSCSTAQEKSNEGEYKVEFELTAYRNAVFFYSIIIGSLTEKKSMVLLKTIPNK